MAISLGIYPIFRQTQISVWWNTHILAESWWCWCLETNWNVSEDSGWRTPLSPSDVGRPFVGSPGGQIPSPPCMNLPKTMPKSWTSGNDGEKPSLYKCHPVAKLSLAMTCQWSGLVLLNPWTTYCNYPPGKTFGHLPAGVDPAGVDWSAAARGRCAQRSGETEPRLDPAICLEGWWSKEVAMENPWLNGYGWVWIFMDYLFISPTYSLWVSLSINKDG